MLPNGLPELIYKVTPDYLREHLKVIVFSRKSDTYSGALGICCSDGNNQVIQLYPTQILHFIEKSGVLSFNYWYKFLEVTLHEIGHAVDHTRYADRTFKAQQITRRFYEESHDCHAFVEKAADDWCNMMMNIIASRDPRLGQPHGWIGGLPGIYLMRIMNRQGEYQSRIQNCRAYKSGGQYSLSHVVRKVCRCMRLHDEKTHALVRREILNEASRIGFSRIYTDKAGREHLFFNHGEMMQIVGEVCSGEKLIKWKEKRTELKNLDPPKAYGSLKDLLHAIPDDSEGLPF